MLAVNAEPPMAADRRSRRDVQSRPATSLHGGALQLAAMPLAIIDAQGVNVEPIAARDGQRKSHCRGRR